MNKSSLKPSLFQIQYQLIYQYKTSYRSAQSSVIENKDKVDYYTFLTPSQHSIKIVIKGLLNNISNDETVDKLKTLGFKPTKWN